MVWPSHKLGTFISQPARQALRSHSHAFGTRRLLLTAIYGWRLALEPRRHHSCPTSVCDIWAVDHHQSGRTKMATMLIWSIVLAVIKFTDISNDIMNSAVTSNSYQKPVQHLYSISSTQHVCLAFPQIAGLRLDRSN